MRAAPLFLCLSLLAPTAARAGDGPHPLRDLLAPVLEAARPRPGAPDRRLDQVVGDLAAGAQKAYAEVQDKALDRLVAARRPGACGERRARLTAALPAVRRALALSESIYTDGHGDLMAAAGQTEKVISAVRVAYQEHKGDYYAEARLDPADRQLVLVFRGTRPTSRSDVFTDLAAFTGADTPYYRWAADLAAVVAARHPGWRVVTTGHSLGGGLAMRAALAVPGATAMVFNPAGLSQAAWNGVSPAERQRALGAFLAFVAVTPRAVDPVAAVALAGHAVIPARLYAVPVRDPGDPKARHGLAPLGEALARADSLPDSCDWDLGPLGAGAA